MDNVLFSNSRLRLYTLGGLVIACLSLAVNHAGYYFGDNSISGFDAFFLVNFGLAVVYWLASSIHAADRKGLLRFWKFEPPMYRITVILFTIAAFSLNRSMEVLGDTPFWLGAYLYLAFLGLFLDLFADRLPAILNVINAFLCGMGLVICFYFSLMVLPMLPFAAIGLVVFGISSVAFAPLFALGGFIAVLRKRKARALRIGFISGAVLPVLFLLAFMAQYRVVKSDMKAVLTEHNATGSDLPRTIFAAQYLPDRAMSRQLMQVNDRNRFEEIGDLLLFAEMGTNSNNNDPLTVLGQGLAGNMPLNRLQRQQIIATQTDLRHESHRRLWEDDHLLTREVNTEIEIYPEYRLAYTEKTFEIEHFGRESTNRRWREEAVYTFHLPEGAVATSLSLWVDGEERKARFSSKGKADSAYASVVGVEKRDPALMHWQEGNRLMVSVFPVQPDLPRRFKIGVTAPLRLQKGDLVLENIYFEGPTDQFAHEKARIRIIGDQVPQKVEVPGYFDRENDKEWTYEGSYETYWELRFPEVPISNRPFAFNGFSYRAYPHQPALVPHRFERVYLDLNRAWTAEDFAGVWEQVGDREVWTFDREMKRVTDSNREEVFNSAREARFSIFPFYKIKDPASALVVSKSAPNFVEREDLEESTFGEEMTEFLKSHPEPVAFYNIGAALGPYLRTLREFGALNYVSGGTGGLGGWLRSGQFLRSHTDSGTVVLHDAGMVIEQSDAEEEAATAPGAPDHLLRLFAYNKSLETAGRNYLLDAEFSEEALRIAEEAYVVSPFTSLIVLETDADYERFGIDESENSLGNAGLQGMAGKGTGSVPEPHEWLLIGLVVLLLVYTQRRRFRLA